MNDGPRTVLQVFGVMDRGGAELRAVELMRHLDPDRFRLAFATLTGRPGTLAEQIRDLGGEVHPCRLDLAFPARFAGLLRRVHPDVVHSCVATFSGAVLAAAHLAGVPRRVAHFHSSDDRHGQSARGRAQRAIMRRLIDVSATDLVAVAEAAMLGLWRPGWRSDPRCRVVYNGLDLDPYARALDEVGPDRPEQPTMVHVGRPGRLKNRARAVDVLATVRRHGTPARLLIVGRQDPAETAALVTRAAAAGVRDHVDLLGERLDVPRLLASSDLLLLTSHHEGLPSVVMEARAAGTPVLATDLPGVREIARHLGGVTTRPLAASDERWASAASSLLTRPPNAAGRAAALRAFRASPFTIDAARRELTAIWSAS